MDLVRLLYILFSLFIEKNKYRMEKTNEKNYTIIDAMLCWK